MTGSVYAIYGQNLLTSNLKDKALEVTLELDDKDISSKDSVRWRQLYDQLIETKSNLRRKKRHRTKQGSNFLGGSFSNKDNITAQSN